LREDHQGLDFLHAIERDRIVKEGEALSDNPPY